MTFRILGILALALLGALTLAGCSKTSVPSGCTPVKDFQVDRYMGTWYEVARLENKFEKGMTHCTADYSLKESGAVQVVNRGWKPEDLAWKESVGTALFLGEKTVGSLRVSFFGPFWGGYHILALDQEAYQWAMVAGPNREYLWFLSRTPQMDPAVLERLKEEARKLDFPVDQLLLVDQADRPEDPQKS